ncbi:MAG: sulfur transferase domain-containing protein [Halioglobus sp.]
MKRRIVSIVAPVVVLFVSCALAGGAATRDIEKVDIDGIRKFSRLSGSSGFGGSVVGFGGATQPSAMATLKNEGFVAVINLRLASEEDVEIDASRVAAEAEGLRYIHLPLDSAKVDPEVIENMLATIGDQANQPVYIHCGSATRAAALWMIGRVSKDGWEVDAATAEVEVIALKPPEAIAFATAYIKSQGR